MPNWGEVLHEIQETKMENPLDFVRRKYLRIMHKYTGRNIIAFYSAFLQNPTGNVSINDEDKNALMQAVNGLNKEKGLDIILHTPGGNIAAAESIVEYLRAIFGNDIRAFIPQIAMSAGTMIALSCKEIVMGKQSNIGPIDPQFGGMSCSGILEEFETAKSEIIANPSVANLWAPIISKYHPTFLGDCKKAIEWSKTTVKQWLVSNMMSYEKDPDASAEKIVSTLSSHKETFNHSKHIHIDECISLGIKVTRLESFPPKKIEGCADLQDCVLTIHHAYMQTFSGSAAVKIVENHLGNAMITSQIRKNN